MDEPRPYRLTEWVIGGVIVCGGALACVHLLGLFQYLFGEFANSLMLGVVAYMHLQLFLPRSPRHHQ